MTAASAAALLASTALGYPLDCIKVQMQSAASAPAGKGTVAIAAHKLRSRGLSTFTSGAGAPLLPTYVGKRLTVLQWLQNFLW
eukprot:513654-Pleurochrysis_carterae.AAC.3